VEFTDELFSDELFSMIPVSPQSSFLMTSTSLTPPPQANGARQADTPSEIRRVVGGGQTRTTAFSSVSAAERRNHAVGIISAASAAANYPARENVDVPWSPTKKTKDLLYHEAQIAAKQESKPTPADWALLMNGCRGQYPAFTPMSRDTPFNQTLFGTIMNAAFKVTKFHKNQTHVLEANAGDMLKSRPVKETMPHDWGPNCDFS
jgi:hypothetical protein